MSFQVIAGSGHCGTMWLAAVLDSVPGQDWHHELRTTLTGMPWQEADAYAPDDPCFDGYWRRIREIQDVHGIVGDSNSWPPYILGVVNRIMPIDRVIYLTRDKEKQLRSLSTQSPVLSAAEWHPAAERKAHLYWTCLTWNDDPHPDEWNSWTREEKMKLLVDANDFMPDWLRDSYGLTVDVYSLEELTTDIDKLRELAPLTDAELQAWQLRDINRKVPA